MCSNRGVNLVLCKLSVKIKMFGGGDSDTFLSPRHPKLITAARLRKCISAEVNFFPEINRKKYILDKMHY